MGGEDLPPALPDEVVDLPAWSLREAEPAQLKTSAWPQAVTREWAWGGSTGRGVRVCVVDSGIDGTHPLVGQIDGGVAISREESGATRVEEGDSVDVAGHGTACASIIRSLAPDCSLFSARVLGSGMTGRGLVLIDGVRWALEHDFDVISLSLSTTRTEFGAMLHELADSAYFRRVVLVASAHNRPVESYPWHFSSVVSVGSHRERDPWTFFYNSAPPVEFFARGVDVEVAWLGGGTLRCTGNSFAAPHIAGISALILGKHPNLTPFELKNMLYLSATNVESA